MDRWIERFKPAAPQNVHVLLAALMWTVVGGSLFYSGARWVMRAETGYVYLQLAVAIILGVLKARFVLDRAAGRIIERIRVRGDGRCLGGFVSLKTWTLIALMAMMGWLFRGGLFSEHIVGLLYTAIGTALAIGARNFWRAW
ncbi:MAG: hypothetical protein KAV82_10080 [Phycisphaerae bacterium]|nr:hypothetical protein [Phycisphaerae bacterium]